MPIDPSKYINSKVLVFDEGTSQGQVKNINFTGAGVAASVSGDTATVNITGSILSQEDIEDYVGAMVSGNTETGIAVTYDDAGGKLNFDAQTGGDARYAPIAKGVTNGDSHDHNGGDGAQIDHANLSSIGTNTHAQIDTFIGSRKIIYKSADETVNNSITLQDDDALIFPVLANEIWAFTMFLNISTGATPDFKYKFTVPTGTTIRGFSQQAFAVNTELLTQFVSGGASGIGELVTGTFFASSTPGNIVLQWAQNTATVADTKVLAGSYIIATKLA